MSDVIKKTPSLTNQSTWLLFAKFVGYFFAFLLPLLVVRFLSKEEVGSYRLIFQIIVNAVGILPLGFSLSVFYFLSRSKEDRSRTILNILLFNFVAGGIAFAVFFFFPELIGGLLNSEEITRLAPLAGIVIWLWIFGIFLEIVAVANQEPKVATVFIILSQFTKTLLMTCAVFVFASVESIIYAAMVQAGLQIIVLLAYLNSRFRGFWRSFDPGFLKKQAVYALPFGFAGILWIMQTDIHNYFVGYRFGEVGFAIYAYGCFEFPLITMLFESVSSVMIPKMSEFQSEGRTQAIIDTTISAMNKLALAYMPIFVFLMIVSSVFITTLFTKEYAASIPIFRVNLFLIPIYIVMLDPIARAYGEVGRFLLKFRIVLLALVIAALWFGIQYFDLTGMIWIVVVSIAVDRAVTFVKVAKILELKTNQLYLLKDIGLTVIAAGVAGVVLAFFYWFTNETLLGFCNNLADTALQPLGLEKFIGLIGGSFYLGICLAIYAPVYLLIVNRLGLVHEDQKGLLRNALRRPFATVFGKGGSI
ncbi:MAG: oligosaccharide flippase family protein [Acidobacteriota bacterium]|nr:oligosaccharide flippase family protein [Acidobacteriota bacterium]MDH3528438.1 oligosaccharide flippase family protein [Acidobacteriota bacterium]